MGSTHEVRASSVTSQSEKELKIKAIHTIPMNITPSNRLAGTQEYYFSRKLREIEELRAAGADIISLGVGGPDLPPHPAVVARLSAEAAKPTTHAYQSYKGTPLLREAFGCWYARRYGVSLDPATEILPLIGSKEGLMHITMTYLNAGDRVLVPNPGYPTYRSAVELAGGECLEYTLSEEQGWMPDLERIEREGLERVKLMMVNLPHMPTGGVPTPELFEQLIAFAQRNNILLVHDNPYSFIRNPQPRSLMAFEGAMEVAVELNSLSKSHSMAGWRVGVVVGAAARIEEILRFKSNMDSGMFYPLQAAAAEALDLDDAWYEELNATYTEREAYGYQLLDALGCTYQTPQAGLFVWGRVPDNIESGYAYSDQLLHEAGLFITPGGIFGSAGERYIRISLCSPVSVLEEALRRVEKMKTTK